jgi:hypothetical protein
MVLELIAALSAGFALFGVAMLAAALMRRKLPKWGTPAAFAAGMLFYVIWADYGWVDTRLPPDGRYVVAEQVQTRIWYRPWSWVFPQVQHVLVLDRSFTRVNADQPDLVMTRIVRLARYVPESGFLAVFDCAGSRMAPLIEGVDLSVAGLAEGADWATLPEGDPVLQRACALREEFADVRGDTR